MAVKLRLRRMGKKKKPFYRIVATDSRVARDGKYIDKVGHYNPVVTPPEILVDDEKALLWLNRGAIPTDSVKNIFSQKGIMLRYHLMKQGLEPAKIDEEVKKWELLQTERDKRQEALLAQQEREHKKAAKEAEKEAAKAAKAEATPEVTASEQPEVSELSVESGNTDSSEPAAEQPEPAPEGSDEEAPTEAQ
ncbi:30S ribosomal protein S16 [candidate division KSB1 bacterium]|nr:30S ribosomal protein S16 [candidate division KSB1 bacterium]